MPQEIAAPAAPLSALELSEFIRDLKGHDGHDDQRLVGAIAGLLIRSPEMTLEEAIRAFHADLQRQAVIRANRDAAEAVAADSKL